MNKSVIFLAMVLLVTGCATTHHSLELTEIAERVIPSVVLIVMFDAEGNAISQGTGFFVSQKGQVMTNYHVVAGADTGAIKTANGKIYAIRSVVAKDSIADLILLETSVPTEEVRPLSLEYSLPKVGEKVAVIGNPLGLEKTLTGGYISAIQEFEKIGQLIQFDAAISPGSSGSPLVNKEGKVIGIVTSQFEEGEGLNFAVPIEKILTLTQVKKEPIAEQKKPIDKDEWYSYFPAPYIPCFVFIDEDDFENAKSCFEERINQNPNDGFAYFWLGLCHSELGDSIKYSSLLDTAMLYLKSNLQTFPYDSLNRLTLAFCYELLSLYDEAIETYNSLMKLHPNWAVPYKCLADLYREIGEDTDAIICYREFIKLNPEDVDALFSLGEIYLFRDEYMEASELFRRVTVLDPNHSDAYKNLGYIYEQTGLYKDAIQSYEAAIKANVEDLQLYFSIASIYEDKVHDSQSAFDWYVNILKIDPYNRAAIFSMVSIYKEVKMFAEAEELLLMLVKHNPDDWYVHEKLTWFYGIWQFEFRDLEKESQGYGLSPKAIECSQKAILHYKQMLRIQPNDDNTYFSMGQQYIKIGEYYNAIRCFSKSIQLDPNYWFSYERLASAYERLGDYKNAIKNYELSIKYSTEDNFHSSMNKQWCHFCLGLIYLKNGKKRQARIQYNILKSMNSGWAESLLEKMNDY